MKKLVLVLFITLLASVLSANPMEEIDNWVARQTEGFDANDVVTFMNGRAEGDITFGSEYVIATSETAYNSVTALDATHFVVAYRDHSNSDYGTAVVGTVSGTAITFGSEYVFNSAVTIYISATTLDATHFVVAYRDDGNSYYGTALVGTVSGSTITYVS